MTTRTNADGQTMAAHDAAARSAAGVNWRAVVRISAVAVALYVAFRLLPTGTNLHHMDFQVSGAGALEMCDPSKPQFIPVVAARSPVRLELRPADGAGDAVADGAGDAVAPGASPMAGRETRFVLSLATSTGKPVAPEDLLTVHTRKLHLLVIDPSLRDYQHLHPEPGAVPGEWTFAHRPRLGGDYRVFADFTPAATGRGLYSFADYTAAAGPETAGAAGAGEGSGGPAEAAGSAAGGASGFPVLGAEVAEGAWRLRLATTDGAPVRAGAPATLVFSAREQAGGVVPLTLVMDAYAHLVAFDAARSGFAHLHPRGERPGDYAVKTPDAREPRLFFDLTIPTPGRYVVWAQVNLEGREHFLPFELPVMP